MSVGAISEVVKNKKQKKAVGGSFPSALAPEAAVPTAAGQQAQLHSWCWEYQVFYLKR